MATSSGLVTGSSRFYGCGGRALCVHKCSKKDERGGFIKGYGRKVRKKSRVRSRRVATADEGKQ